MGFISFLKRAGQILANVTAIEAGLGPIFKAQIPATGPAVDKLDLILKQVVAVEGAFQAAFPTTQTGPQKLLAAASLIGPVLQSVDTITGKHIHDEAAYTKAIQGIAGNLADLLNSLDAQPNPQLVAASIVAAGTAASGAVQPNP